MRGLAIGGRVDGHRLAAELVQRADHAHRDLAAVRDQYPREHQRVGGGAIGSSSKRSWPNSTAAPFSTWIAVTRPVLSALSSLKSFIASSRHNVCPGVTTSPTSTKGAAPGSG